MDFDILREELTDDEDFLELIDNVMRAPRVFRERVDHYEKWNDEEFKKRFRLSKQVVRFIVEQISHEIASSTDRNLALTPDDMVLATLRFLATGSILSVIGDLSGIDKATTCRVIEKVITSIARLRPNYIEMPNTPEEITDVRQGFYNIAKFPKCIGAIDCTHVRIVSPGGENAELFRNRKSFFSVNVQAVCDSHLVIRNIVARWQGSAHDSTIFNHSNLKTKLENQEFGRDSLLVGDSGYAIRPYLITPLSNPHTRAEHLFNEAQIRTRNPIERCFGAWKRRFPVLALGVRLKINKVERIIVAAAVLHNIACLLRDPVPQVTEEEEAAIELTNNVNLYYPNEQRHIGININNEIRHKLITHYFQNLL